MRPTFLYSAAALVLTCLSARAHADTYQFRFGGGGVSGTAVLTYGTASDAKYPQALEITGISGTFSDSNLGISDASILGLESLNRASPEPTNLLAPHDFSHFKVEKGLEHGFLSYDNLFYPGGSPQTATDYHFGGGFMDIYGVLFDIGDGRLVNFYSNGDLPHSTAPDYGVAVVTSDVALDYVAGGVAVTPEPGTLGLLGTGLVGLLWRRRA